MKIMVIDSQGAAIPQGLRDILDNCRFRGVEPPGQVTDPDRCHPHGVQVGYWAGVLQDDAEIVFVRIFDEDARPIAGATDWMLDVIADERPDYINRSWGLAQPDTRWGRMIGQAAYGQWVQRFQNLKSLIGFVDFGAAGNNGDWWPDNDVAYPQRLMPGSAIIGSARRNGVASKFSSDGPEVQCVLTGENLMLFDGVRWSIGSGTSFACPKACGLAAKHRLTQDEWESFCSIYGSKPEGYEDEQSNKWGRHGNMSDRFQVDLARVPKRRLPPTVEVAMMSADTPRYFNFERHAI